MVNKKGWLYPAKMANENQQKMIQRKYGMFIHFGVNTFNELEWSDGTLEAKTFNPKNLNTDDWVLCAKNAGMKYIIFTSKHHDGFCLWPTKLTDYSVEHSSCETDIIKSLAESCKKFDIELGLYYSLWDRHEQTYHNHETYVNYMVNQLEELLTNYGPICELWLDGGWEKKRDEWDIPQVYECVKKYQPNCNVGVNWTIGLPENEDAKSVLPKDQKEGYPFRYFPSDFRLGDPHLPVEHDPKLFTHGNESYYLPFESTVCLNKKWFWSETDQALKEIDELAKIYQIATAQDNVLILNSPPNKDGLMPKKNAARLKELNDYLTTEAIT